MRYDYPVLWSAHDRGNPKPSQPDEGPSAERFRPSEFKRESQGGGGGATLESPTEAEHITLNQDGSVLDAAGGPVTNPVGSISVKHYHLYEHPSPTIGPIGDNDHPLSAEDAQTREQHAGFSGGPGTGDFGIPGSLEGDASNIGGTEPRENF